MTDSFVLIRVLDENKRDQSRHRYTPTRTGPCFSSSRLPNCCFCLSPFPITYSPCFSSYYPLALVSGQLSRHFPLDIKRRPTQCCPSIIVPNFLFMYQSLWDVPIDTGATALISTLNVYQNKGFAKINHTDDPDFIEPRESASMTQKKPGAHEDARIFIPVVWANKFDIHILSFFPFFPEVFHAGCTCDTNNTNYHLLTFSCRKSTGNQIVFLCVWIPNQKRVCFPLGFQICTNQLEAHVFRRTRLVMVDGNPQQRVELSKAILSYMPNAMDGGCGWHIVEQGWKAHGPGKTAVNDAKRDKCNLFKKRVKDWYYTWMTPGGVESNDEYTIIKQLLFAYLASPEMLDACDGQQNIIDQVSEFLRNHVIVYDQAFLLFKTKCLLYFNVKTSSAHKGTHFGIKEHAAAAVLPSHKIHVTGQQLSLQSSMTGTQGVRVESIYVASSQSLLSQSPTANHVTTLAKSILSRAIARTHDYYVRRTAIAS
jgi:hypothetical protein